MASQSIQEQISCVPFWWHSIDIGGIVTPGLVPVAWQQQMLRDIRLPNLKGKSVLDIGTFDGFFAFEAERRGASRVVALDHYVWERRIDKCIAYWQERNARGESTRSAEFDQFIDRENLPGKIAFDTAHRLLCSKVEPVVADFMTMDLRDLGEFDVVLYLGVLYHMTDPLGALSRVAQVTREVAVIETQAVSVLGGEDLSLCEFYPENQLNNDYSNWWAPNANALAGLCRAGGFSRIDLLSESPRSLSLYRRLRRRVGDIVKRRERERIARYRAIARAWK
jgi:tRNA (mo5U34)-methyltransferase